MLLRCQSGAVMTENIWLLTLGGRLGTELCVLPGPKNRMLWNPVVVIHWWDILEIIWFRPINERIAVNRYGCCYTMAVEDWRDNLNCMLVMGEWMSKFHDNFSMNQSVM